jgi:hypothetical protein
VDVRFYRTVFFLRLQRHAPQVERAGARRKLARSDAWAYVRHAQVVKDEKSRHCLHRTLARRMKISLSQYATVLLHSMYAYRRQQPVGTGLQPDKRSHIGSHISLLLVANMSRSFGLGFTAAMLLSSCALSAGATPPPPPAAPQLRLARMTVAVELVEARNGKVSKLSKLCTVSGNIPVYADPGHAASFNAGEISGCTMQWKGQTLRVSVLGAMAVARDPSTFVTAGVSVVPPGSIPLCPDLCGPQALADSSGEIRVSGTPASLQFSLHPNPVSLLNARPTVWFNADVAVAD